MKAKTLLHINYQTEAYNYSLDALNDAKLELGEQNALTAEAFFVTGLISKEEEKMDEALVFLTCALNISELVYDKNPNSSYLETIDMYKKELEAI